MQAVSCHSCNILYFTWLNNSQQQETESRQGHATITKLFQRCLVRANKRGEGVKCGGNDRRASCFSTDKHFSLLPRSSPLQLTEASPVFVLSPDTLSHLFYSFICIPTSKFSHLSPSYQPWISSQQVLLLQS